MPMWFHEQMLDKYWIDRCKIYKVNGQRILGAKLNPIFDRYPDISENQLENGDIVPCEIEWATTDFNHDLSVLENNNGFLVTFVENAEFPLPQIKINEEDFIDWFTMNSKKIANETLNVVREKSKKRNVEFIWLIYLGSRNKKDSNIAFQNGVWGFPKSELGKRRGYDRIVEILPNDIVVFARGFKFNKDNKLKTTWTSNYDKLIGKLEEIVIVRVTKDFYCNTANNEPWSNDNYPYRFDFDKNFILKARDVPCTPDLLGQDLHHRIVGQMSKRSIEHMSSSYLARLMTVCHKYRSY